MNRTIMHALHRVWISGLVMLAVLPMAGWARSSPPGQPGEGDGPVNAMCPVTTDEPIDPRFIVEYEGNVVGFCCRKCRTKFEQDPAHTSTTCPLPSLRMNVSTRTTMLMMNTMAAPHLRSTP